MATLKQLVDETTNIKNEIVDCHSTLKSKLETKGIEVTPSDKMKTLIDKVDGMYNVVEEEVAKLRLFNADSDKGYIYELDPNTIFPIKYTKSVGERPTGIGGGFDGTKLRLFHADTSTGKLYELDPDTLEPINTVTAPGTKPTGIGGGFDGTKLRLYHIDSDKGKVYELDVDTLQPIKTGNTYAYPADIGGGFDGSKLRLFYINNGIYINELNPNTLEVINEIRSETRNGYSIGGGFDGTKLRLYYGDHNVDKISELSTDTLNIIKTVTSPAPNPQGVGGGHYMIKKKYVTVEDVKYELMEA